MRYLRATLVFLMTLVLLTGALGRARVSWVCEGRVCSPDLRNCCCASAREETCGENAKVEIGSACAGRCACVAVTTAESTPALASASPAFDAPPPLGFDDLPATLPPGIVASPFTQWPSPQIRAIPPPPALRDVFIAFAALRAPPARLA